MVGIAGYGVYLPRFRVKREEIAKVWGGKASGENFVLNFDEDVVTMAVEASVNAVNYVGVNPEQIDGVYFCTSSSPDMERPLSAIVAEVLGTKAEAIINDFGASTRSATAALIACLDAVKTGRVKFGLVVASDCRKAAPGSELEPALGAGAAALIISDEKTIAEIEDSYSYSSIFIDRWRSARDPFVREYHDRFSREYGYVRHVTAAAQGIMQNVKRKTEEFNYLVLSHQPDERLPARAARRLGAKPDQMKSSMIAPLIGDTGSSSIFLELASTLDKARPDEKILMVSYGSGSGDAFSLVTTDKLEVKKDYPPSVEDYFNSKEYVNYTTYLKNSGILIDSVLSGNEMKGPRLLQPSWVLPVTSPKLWRESPEIFRLVAAKCRSCGYINFPRRKICLKCGKHGSLDEIRLSKNGKVYTFTVNYYVGQVQVTELPLPWIVAELNGGGRYFAVGTEFKADEIEIGMPVRLVLRKYREERNMMIYGYKFTPPRFGFEGGDL